VAANYLSRVPRFVTTAIIGGMRSVHSARAVYTALAAVPGVTTAEVVLGRAIIEHDGRATAESLRAAIAVAGCELLETTEERQRSLPLL
jgi:copper chaperone CopZ